MVSHVFIGIKELKFEIKRVMLQLKEHNQSI